jgi:hypothetical protein
MPNGGGGGPSSDGLVDLGGDNSIGRYCGGISIADVQEPGVEEPSGGETCVEEPSHSWQSLARSSAGWRLGWNW